VKTLFAYLTVLLLAMSQAVNATTISTGEDLQKVCNAVEGFSECVTFLEVVYQTAKAIAHMNDGEPSLKLVIGSCGPNKGIDTVPLVIALRAAWQEYAKKHPEQLRNLAVGEALLAFEARWPCKR
jgi:hypothetical protein